MYTNQKGVCQKMAKKKVYDEDFKKMIVELYVLILTLKYTKTAQNYQDKKTNNIKIVILK